MALKVFLVGINEYEESPLRGCVPDVNEVQKLLVNKHRTPRANIRKLLDRDATRDAILDGLKWLVKVEPGEKKPRRLFHYSGHGSWVTDAGRDEEDKRDESICPVDYPSRGFINDDTLGRIYRQATPETHLLLLMDCCHSGTNQRFPDATRRPRTVPPPKGELGRLRAALKKAESEREAKAAAMVKAQLAKLTAKGGDKMSAAERKGMIEDLIRAALQKLRKSRYGLDMTVKGNTVLLAGCRADQTSADATFGTLSHGALTYFVLKTLDKSPGISYTKLVDKVSKALEDHDFEQIPQLECEKANLERPFLDLSSGRA